VAAAPGLLLLKALEEGQDVPGALARYQDATRRLGERLGAEPAPNGLAPFQDDVLAALTLQQAFFAKAAPLRQAGRSMADVYQIAEGRQASARLISAWGRMQARYLPGRRKPRTASTTISARYLF
jgi:hypothetical protein